MTTVEVTKVGDKDAAGRGDLVMDGGGDVGMLCNVGYQKWVVVLLANGNRYPAEPHISAKAALKGFTAAPYGTKVVITQGEQK